MIIADGERVRAGRGARRWLPEIVVGVLSAVVIAVVSAHIPPRSDGRSLDALGYAVLVVAGLAMGGCRRWPRSAALAVTAVLCVVVARDYPSGPVWLTGLVVLGALSWRTERRTAVVGAIVMLVALTVTATTVGGLSAAVSLIYVGWTAAVVFLGEALRNRRRYLSGLAERTRFAERSRADETARRVAEERLRIARDLHDSVAHAMATINVQAGAAAHVLERKPEAAGAALSAIQRASAEVLDELGSMLSVLRDGAERAERAPAPGLADVERLVDSVRPSGLDVELRTSGPTPATSTAQATAAYRVVQESLTNVLRHSAARRVQVCIVAGPDGALCVEVGDPGPARDRDTAGTGVGIRGMRERVAATGGRFTAGPTADGGFAVRAEWTGSG
ncbi:MAG TPA: histidine kinase [Jatrophihabitans sp.]|nr:histidine kinase [Jatrophihabitans sp.]